jgi:hypothetical protein
MYPECVKDIFTNLQSSPNAASPTPTSERSLFARLRVYTLRLLIQLGHNIYNNNDIKRFYFGIGSGYAIYTIYTIYTIGARDGECE